MSTKHPRKRLSRPDRETRERRAYRRLGTDRPSCCRCGISKPELLARHHIAQRAYDDLCVILCHNCHALLTDSQFDHPPGADGPPTMLDRIGRLLLGLADFLGALVGKLREFGEYLIRFALTLPDGALA